MDEKETDKKNYGTVKPKIISCLLEKDVANTAEIANYCGFGEIEGNKYRYVTRQLDELVEDDLITQIKKYRPKESRWRRGTGYKLTRELDWIWIIYINPKYADIRPKFLESEWLRELIIESRILPGEEKNKRLLHLMLQISPSFFKFCFGKFCFAPLTADTLRSWDTPVSNSDWLDCRLSTGIPVDTLSRDIQFLELFRFSLFQDWVEIYTDEKIPDDLHKLLEEIYFIEFKEIGRILGTVLAYRTAESINHFTVFEETNSSEKKENLNELVLHFSDNQFQLVNPKSKNRKMMETHVKELAYEISKNLGFRVGEIQKEPPEQPYAFFEHYLEKRKSIPELKHSAGPSP